MKSINKSQLELISSILRCLPEEISIEDDNIGGMTNNSIVISVRADKKYVVRLPGKGSDELIDREQEYKVYNFLHDIGYDTITVFLSHDGLKITKYIKNAYNCNPNNRNNVLDAMSKLRELHNFDLHPDIKYFSLIGNIDKYRELAQIRNVSPRIEYDEVYYACLQVAAWIERLPRKCCLCQIDANPDNTIFAGCSAIPILIDFEYAALQDPHLDIAMWAAYCGYSKERFDELLCNYFQDDVDDTTRYKIYGYAALAGMLWYNWCLYKLRYGISYGGYTERQFDYAKKYSALVLKYLQNK